MASTVDHFVYQDFTFHGLETLSALTLPKTTVAVASTQAEGSVVYNTADNLPYYSDGRAWVPLLAVPTDATTLVVPTGVTLSLGTLDISEFKIQQTAVGPIELIGDPIALTSFGSDITFAAIGDITLANNLSTGQITISPGSGGFRFSKTTVTQTTNINTGVTANQISAVITTQTASTAGNDTDIFTVTNNRVLATSVILATIVDYSGAYDGTNGMPTVNIDNIQSGSFDVVIVNADDSTALNGVLKIAFLVV